MKINKIIIFTFLSLFFIIGANIVLAENDDEEEYRNENDFKSIVIPIETPIAPIAPVVVPISAPIITAKPIVTSQPVFEAKTINTQISEVISNVLIDSDQDGIVDSLDLHPGEDDFAFTNDVNQNGIVDDLEYLVGR